MCGPVVLGAEGPTTCRPGTGCTSRPNGGIKAGCFAAMAHAWRAVLRLALERNEQPSAVIMDSWTLQSTPESGDRAGFAGPTKRKGSKVHAAVDTLGHLLALRVTPANEQDRAPVAPLAQAVQSVTEQKVEVALVDQGDTDEEPAAAAAAGGHSPGNRKAARSQAWIWAAAAALVRGTLFWPGSSLPATGPRLRAVGNNTGRISLARFRPAPVGECVHKKSITGASINAAIAGAGGSLTPAQSASAVAYNNFAYSACVQSAGMSSFSGGDPWWG